jgi:hypothetical protein
MLGAARPRPPRRGRGPPRGRDVEPREADSGAAGQLGFVETRYLVVSAPLPEALVPTAALLLVRDRRRR